MDQKKIGKFICELRKQKKLTQYELALKLGVTEKSVSNWENGRNMPDLSLFKPLCDELGISINELMSGERINKDNYNDKFEENIINTIDYSTKKVSKYNQVISLIFIIFGLFISLSAIMIFPSESSWGSIYSVFGILIFMIGIYRITGGHKLYVRIFINVFVFILSLSVLLLTDYINVKLNNQAPMFRIKTVTIGNVIFYDTLFYDVYRCNFDSKDEYWDITNNRSYNDEYLMNYCK